mmetsp:Transcript_73462/g.204076  ORF Transcript_73462/g.204076 Transcript_73462/m.204076 type:complete len:302 (+) Transcript_73462:65-970(+)|eukprot:CAMPEP_0117460826 /NCGR_PEP_ID=MMETSP0784-20121206/2207_1 /TAXON_ID=39447 /ORGANISM="" /LENGTH=301 /DNA_ID=CAMNT_0005254509 /DNA_START=61 /DNA_END=966 /DNA_ORIENTATION=-
MFAKLTELARWSAPSVLTLGALVAGLTAVRCAAEGIFTASVKCVMLAAVLDGLDGHTARYLGTSTELGFELDSLCDLANFGVTPALVMYFWSKDLPMESDAFGQHGTIWAFCCIYCACCALRLARFNVAGRATEMDMELPEAKPPPTCLSVAASIWKNVSSRRLYFQGVPAPVGAAYALVPMMLQLSSLPRVLGAVGEAGAWSIGRRGSAATLLVTAVLMVSPLPTFSSKMLKTYRKDTHLSSRGYGSMLLKLAAVSIFGYVFWRWPFEVFLAMVMSHVLSIPIGVLAFATFVRDGADKDN